MRDDGGEGERGLVTVLGGDWLKTKKNYNIICRS